MINTYKVVITGQVQGVGFRPFVYVLANKFGLVGTVSNNEEGVIIYVTGKKKDVLSFVSEIISSPPPVSKIKRHYIHDVSFQNFEGFEIISSNKSSYLNLQLTPDFALCPDCQYEIQDPLNRRYLYAFTTCVNCGPRWAITNTFPFERSHTSITAFTMCPDCEKEYKDPRNRRFHSQTNSCSKCGITIQLTDNQGVVLDHPESEIFVRLAELLKEGHILALKNTSGYLLCCDATNSEAVRKLRKKKNRPAKPFAILYPDLEMLQDEIPVSPAQLDALSSTERPIVIIPSSEYLGNLALKELTPGLNQLGIMVPYSGILQLLAATLTMPIVATSGNFHGSPIISNNNEASDILQDVADYFVHHDLPISNPQDDSVVKYSRKFEHKVVFRRSRGYAPNYFETEYHGNEKLMAMGAHLKSTIGFLPNNFLYLSQYLGNLDNYDVYRRFRSTAFNFMDIFEVQPDKVLVDSHPAYQSTQLGIELGKKYGAKIIKVQHHKAHFASVLGENELYDIEEPVLGVIWDGTGYGDDAQIWGGEFFSYQNHHMQRVAHFDYFNWLAGDKMALEPRLSFLSLVNLDTGDALAKKFTPEELKIYRSLKEKNRLKTSSVGRLFDAVASALDICDFNTYEGEAAILLENCITDYDLESCKSYLRLDENTGNLPTELLFANLYADIRAGEDKEIIICNFLYTLAHLILDMASKNSTRTIALSGGVFQNTVLIDMLIELAGPQHKLFFNRNLSPNDENIAFGQLSYYLNCKDN